MPDYSWPPQESRRLLGKRISRIDGREKASGRAKYASDINKPGMLFAALLTSPHAHAKVVSVDTSAAKSLNGVTAVRVIAEPGTEIQWAGAEIAVVSATSEEVANDAVRKINVQYEVMPHLVREEDLAKAGPRAKAAGEQITGDPDQGFKEAEVVIEGSYGIPVITHCCLEPHGQATQWEGDTIQDWPSTQNVSGIGGDLAKSLQLPATQIKVHMDHVGGGFGSKFAADRWGVECARLSKESGGKPVKLFLDRATELTIAGVRPSAFAKIKVGAKKDGTITTWQSESWATGGFAGGGSPPIPYVFTAIPNQRKNHTAVSINAGGSRAWRAPNHQQACYLSHSALDDLAAKLNMDPVDLLAKNADLTPRGDVYRLQLKKGAELMDWKKKWHPRGQGGSGPVRHGLGVAISTWQGGGHASQCRANIHPDGSVVVELGSQDLGTGTRTCINMVAAETLGLPLAGVKVVIGDNSLPPSGASGGSTTIGGVSSSTRKATVNALDKLFEAVAPSLGVPKEQLEAVDGKIQVKGNSSKSLAWKAACAKLGTKTISEMGVNDPKNPGGLMSAGVGGVQMAEVSVDTETGIVRMVKSVAVQDVGTLINHKTAESQILGGCIMSICSALMEERIMDQQTGRVLNPDMEFYKLAGIGDIGEIVVHINTEAEFDKRGVIGLGEPAAIALPTAIGNAVANAIGVRVPNLPVTPDRVLAALERRNA
ncbi:MAG TPA: xanthine dehydrogenase family protein molybdopterin-binding subunit [Bryobacteraceae bacterium]|nr:xanthine dehydrogenase family protein molybdopterin-binding subunit [Bryobacteraceae bacterium]